MFRGWRSSTLIGLAVAALQFVLGEHPAEALYTAGSACVVRGMLELLALEYEKMRAAERELDNLG